MGFLSLPDWAGEANLYQLLPPHRNYLQNRSEFCPGGREQSKLLFLQGDRSLTRHLLEL